jgi:chemosensory pili system protein ChpC
MSQTAYGRRKPARKVLRANGRGPELHCMVIPTDRDTLVLPTSTVAEVVDYHDPLAIEASPPWLLGQIEWENRQVPVFSFSALINGDEVGAIPARARIMILKSLSDSVRVPYLGLLLADLPHPVSLRAEDVVEVGDDKKSLGVFSRVALDEGDAIIPDLDRLAHLVTHAAFGALPITQL